jgi:hypothetical protein
MTTFCFDVYIVYYSMVVAELYLKKSLLADATIWIGNLVEEVGVRLTVLNICVKKNGAQALKLSQMQCKNDFHLLFTRTG